MTSQRWYEDEEIPHTDWFQGRSLYKTLDDLINWGFPPNHPLTETFYQGRYFDIYSDREHAYYFLPKHDPTTGENAVMRYIQESFGGDAYSHYIDDLVETYDFTKEEEDQIVDLANVQFIRIASHRAEDADLALFKCVFRRFGLNLADPRAAQLYCDIFHGEHGYDLRPQGYCFVCGRLRTRRPREVGWTAPSEPEDHSGPGLRPAEFPEEEEEEEEIPITTNTQMHPFRGRLLYDREICEALDRGETFYNGEGVDPSDPGAPECHSVYASEGEEDGDACCDGTCDCGGDDWPEEEEEDLQEPLPPSNPPPLIRQNAVLNLREEGGGGRGSLSSP